MNPLVKGSHKGLVPAPGYYRWLAAAVVSAAVCAPVDHVSAASLVTKDTVSKREGALTGGARYTEDGGGHSGQPGDSGIDFGAAGSGPIVVDDGSFLNVAAANDEMSFGFWTKKYDIAAGSAFWALSPSSNNGQRGWQAHVPWDNNNIYFDTAGCCAGNQRINASVTAFQPYVDFAQGNDWWKNWHYFVFSKKGGSKQIWIDGVLFLQQETGAGALPTDFTKLMIGSDNAGNGLFHAVIDDFAVFSKQLTESDIIALAGGAKASSLDASTGLLAYWDFNDPPAEGQLISVSPAAGSTTGAPNLIQVVHIDGGIPWDQGNVSLKVDGATVTPTVTKNGSKATVSFVPAKPFEIQSSHSAALTYPVAGGTKVLEWSFVVGPYTLDTVASRVGALTGGSGFTLDAIGHSGAPGDRAIDFGRNGSGPVVVGDASFLNTAAANDEVTFAFWSKKYDIAAGSAFWAVSPSSGQRGYQAHVPWSDNTVYFDSAGCCNGGQRLSGGIANFQPYADSGLGQDWWKDWHYYVFSKNQGNKQVWIDGVLFLQQETGASALPQDFTRLMIGSDNAGGGLFHALVDDFAVFSTQLTEADVQALAGGAKASSLSPDTGLLAYFEFNDFPPNGLFASIVPTPDSIDALPNLIQVVHQQGAAGWDLSKVSLKLDGKVVPAVVTLDPDQAKVTVKYVPASLLPAKSSHTAVLTYPVGADLLTKTWQFTVSDYTLDTLHQYLGALRGAAKFSTDGGGRSGSPGDFAVDLGKNQTGQSVDIPDASFLNEAAANDEIAVGGWQKLYGIHDSAFFWGVSPTSNGSQRGLGTHAPWSNNNLYFDTAGCCGGDQRTSAAITTFPPYQQAGVGEAWWQDWHYVLFQKKGPTKEIWIDGQLFTTAQNTKILPVDFTRAYIGRDPVDANAAMQGLVDDVAVFKTALTEPDIILLASGALPTELSSDVGLIAYWNFNDGGTPGVRLSVSRSGAQLNLSWTGGSAPYVVQRKANLTDAVWETVTTTQTSSAVVDAQGATGFFRISAQ